jgi:superfamily II DNA/RNA helicase
MQVFLKATKLVTELNKGVQGMKHFVYPSILQKQAIPAIKHAKTKNIILHYSELTGVKLTVMLPILNQQLRQSVTNSISDTPKSLFSIFLCHSFIRCGEIAETLTELVTFCADMVEILNLDSADLTETQLKLKKSMQNSTAIKSRILVMTPAMAVKMQPLLANMVCQSIVIDKVELLQALEFTSDLLKL